MLCPFGNILLHYISGWCAGSAGFGSDNKLYDRMVKFEWKVKGKRYWKKADECRIKGVLTTQVPRISMPHFPRYKLP